MWFQLVLLAVFVVNALALLYFKRNGGGEGKSGSAVLGEKGIFALKFRNKNIGEFKNNWKTN